MRVLNGSWDPISALKLSAKMKNETEKSKMKWKKLETSTLVRAYKKAVT